MASQYRTRNVGGGARAIDAEIGFDHDLDGTHAPRATRFGIVLFWSAIVCLIAARVALFDPSAARSVGSFPDQIAPTFQTH